MESPGSNLPAEGQPKIVEHTKVVTDVEDEALDKGWSWFVVLGSAIVHLLIGGLERCDGIFYQQFVSRFHSGASETAWVSSIAATSRVLLGPIASASATRFSCRRVVMIGGLLASFSICFSGYANSLLFLYFIYGVIGGIGRALIYSPSLVIVGYYFRRRRGLAVGLASSGVGLGTLMLPPLSESLFSHYGYTGAFLVLSAVALHYCVSGALFRPLELHRQIAAHFRNSKHVVQQTKANRSESRVPVAIEISAIENQRLTEPASNNREKAC